MTKRILCFGDSNTWGFDPDTMNRFPENVRWTRLLAAKLGDGYEIIEEGQNGRTIATDDDIEGEKNGITYIAPCIESQSPLDLLIIMLGTNDLKKRFALSASDIADEMRVFLGKVQTAYLYHMETPPQILLISPIHMGDNIRDSWLGEDFGFESATERSLQFGRLFKEVAEEFDCHFLDGATLADPSKSDACHMDAAGHKVFAEGVYNKVIDILG